MFSSAPGMRLLYPQRPRKVDGRAWNEPHTNDMWRQPILFHLDVFVPVIAGQIVLVVHDHV